MSSRLRIQAFIESEVGCTDVEKWKSYSAQFKSFAVTEHNKATLRTLLAEDTENLYFKAILSIAEALDALNRGLHSWAVVKLYYSVFYLLRCSMAAKDLCFVKSSGIYTLKLKTGEVPVKRDGGIRNGEQVRGDHKTVIATYIKEFGHNDIFLSNHIEENIPVYDWIMKRREDVNYRNVSFQEPDESIFNSKLFKNPLLSTQIDEYFNNIIYCFMEDHCCLALPIRLAERTAGELRSAFNTIPFTEKKMQVIESLIGPAALSENKNIRNILLLENP